LFCSQLSAHIPEEKVFEADGEISLLQWTTFLGVFYSINGIANYTFVGGYDLV
jgi:hypothetical protein